MPVWCQLSSAAASASCARSSASPTSPVKRARVATTRAPSMRHTASTARRMSVMVDSGVGATRRGLLAAPLLLLLHVLVVGEVGEIALVGHAAHLELVA